MENGRRVVCPDNEGLAQYMSQKMQELAASPKGLPENTSKTLNKAYANVCNSKTPITSLKEFSEVKGVGKWILKVMKGFFHNDNDLQVYEPDEANKKKGRSSKGSRRYLPQKNSVAYALLITLYRLTSNGNEFMRKQELIDAAEASGLSRAPIAPEKGKGKLSQFGSSPREWYSGWSCMKTLITKGLVVKSSCPAKYMLSQEGKETAHECLIRSGLVNSTNSLCKGSVDLDGENPSNSVFDKADSSEEIMIWQYLPKNPAKSTRRGKGTPALQPASSNCVQKDQVFGSQPEAHSSADDGRVRVSVDGQADLFANQSKDFEFSGNIRCRKRCKSSTSSENPSGLRPCSSSLKTSQGKVTPTLQPASSNCVQKDQVFGSQPEAHSSADDCRVPVSVDGQADFSEIQIKNFEISGNIHCRKRCKSSTSSQNSSGLRPCSSSDNCLKDTSSWRVEASNFVSKPPLSVGEKFEEAYEVILILDDREQFATRGSRSRKIVDHVCTQFNIKIEVRRLPVGDAIWIARHKYLDREYVLDFIVERKKVDDLRSSIRDNRYKDQKLRLLRCGLKRILYVVEGDPNFSEAAESIKTACFTTEILEGFDVQRTSGLGDTLKKYGHLTHAIAHYYALEYPEEGLQRPGVCPQFDEFISRCQDLEKMTVSDVFAIQLMQVPHVTEEVALAVVDMYPTLLSLAQAYTLLDGDVHAQEEMLSKQSNSIISAVASRNIFRLVWGD